MVDTLLESSEKAYLPKVASQTNHGHTTAAWVTVSVVMIGLVVGRLLRVLGLGQTESSRPARGSTESGSDIDPSSKEQP